MCLFKRAKLSYELSLSALPTRLTDQSQLPRPLDTPLRLYSTTRCELDGLARAHLSLVIFFVTSNTNVVTKRKATVITRVLTDARVANDRTLPELSSGSAALKQGIHGFPSPYEQPRCYFMAFLEHSTLRITCRPRSTNGFLLNFWSIFALEGPL